MQVFLIFCCYRLIVFMAVEKVQCWFRQTVIEGCSCFYTGQQAANLAILFVSRSTDFDRRW